MQNRKMETQKLNWKHLMGKMEIKMAMEIRKGNIKCPSNELEALEPKILSERNQRINCFISPAPQPIQWKEEKHCVNPSLLSTFITCLWQSVPSLIIFTEDINRIQHDSQMSAFFFFDILGAVFGLHKTDNRKEQIENGWVLNKQAFNSCSNQSDGGP